MGREVKRVALDFVWPLEKVWEGYVNPHRDGVMHCQKCGGDGYSEYAKSINTLHGGFDPAREGKVPFTADHPRVRERAEVNVARSPEYYGSGEIAVRREAERLAKLFNDRGIHFLDKKDVKALLESNYLRDLTHDWSKDGWAKKVPERLPTPEEVNDWSVSSTFGHGGGAAYTVIKSRCEREGRPVYCDKCDGNGEYWDSKENQRLFDEWKPTDPPAGDGWQLWETVSEGSPLSPVFATPEELASYLVSPRYGHEIDRGTSYDTWYKFITGPGWAPSAVWSSSSGMKTGVQSLGEGDEE